MARVWNLGDKVAPESPLEAQRIKADPAIEATRGARAALGPLAYNAELADQPHRSGAGQDAAHPQWRGDFAVIKIAPGTASN